MAIIGTTKPPEILEGAILILDPGSVGSRDVLFTRLGDLRDTDSDLYSFYETRSFQFGPRCIEFHPRMDEITITFEKIKFDDYYRAGIFTKDALSTFSHKVLYYLQNPSIKQCLLSHILTLHDLEQLDNETLSIFADQDAGSFLHDALRTPPLTRISRFTPRELVIIIDHFHLLRKNYCSFSQLLSLPDEKLLFLKESRKVQELIRVGYCFDEISEFLSYPRALHASDDRRIFNLLLTKTLPLRTLQLIDPNNLIHIHGSVFSLISDRILPSRFLTLPREKLNLSIDPNFSRALSSGHIPVEQFMDYYSLSECQKLLVGVDFIRDGIFPIETILQLPLSLLQLLHQKESFRHYVLRDPSHISDFSEKGSEFWDIIKAHYFSLEQIDTLVRSPFCWINMNFQQLQILVTCRNLIKEKPSIFPQIIEIHPQLAKLVSIKKISLAQALTPTRTLMNKGVIQLLEEGIIESLKDIESGLFTDWMIRALYRNPQLKQHLTSRAISLVEISEFSDMDLRELCAEGPRETNEHLSRMLGRDISRPRTPPEESCCTIC